MIDYINPSPREEEEKETKKPSPATRAEETDPYQVQGSVEISLISFVIDDIIPKDLLLNAFSINIGIKHMHLFL